MGEAVGAIIRPQVPGWVKGLEMAAVVVGLLVLYPKSYERMEMRSAPSQFAAAIISTVPEQELASDPAQAEMFARIKNQPSRLVRTYCQRFTEAD
ncbi:MAG: hypothetical protein ABIV39_17920 [Verrucomicrobiota bacterium]